MKKNKRILIFLIFIGLFTLSYSIGSSMQVPEEDAVQFQDEFEALIGDIDGPGIFIHNSVVAMPMFIPGFGVAWGFFSAWQTGQAFSALALLNPIIADVHPLAVLYLSPFGLMELVAYSLAMSRSLIWIHKIIKKIPYKQDFKIIGIEIGIVLGLLLGGGFLEFFMIQFAEDQGFELTNFIFQNQF